MTITIASDKDEMACQVTDLADGVHTHAALNNSFYERWVAAALSYEQVRVFAREYWARTQYTSVMVALSVLHTEDMAARVECVKNLYSEYGNGDLSKAHIVLLEQFFDDLLTRLAGQPVSMSDVRTEGSLPTTKRFSEGQRALFTDSDQRVVQGALLGQEHLAYSMLTRLYEGVRNYKSLWARDDDFHEAAEYFYVHIGEAEKEHKAEAIVSATEVCETEADFAAVKESFERFLDLTAMYWEGVYEAIAVA
ncbi:MAG: iron-containing redox enzyme family protein [Pseudonocardiaceae bacterium]